MLPLNADQSDRIAVAIAHVRAGHAVHLAPGACSDCVEVAETLEACQLDLRALRALRASTEAVGPPAPPSARRAGATAASRAPTHTQRYATDRHERGFKAEPKFAQRLRQLGLTVKRAGDRFSLMDWRGAGFLIEGKERGGNFWDAEDRPLYPTCITGARKWREASLHPSVPYWFAWYAPGLARVAWVRWTPELGRLTTIEKARPDPEREWQREDTAHVPSHYVSIGWEGLIAAIRASSPILAGLDGVFPR